ncbi:MAG: hypothetical protein FJ029_09890, partial [Actinobacteria bacterium]|nr:hypothetical protein [Actinomycetota bacterium]
ERIKARTDADEMLRGYLEARDQTAAGIVNEVRRAAQASGARVGVTAASSGWSIHGLRLADLLPTLGALMLPDPTDEAQEADAQVAMVRASGREIHLTVNQTGAHHVRPHTAAFEARAQRIARIGVDRVMVYNFGLLTPATLRHVGRVLRTHLGVP